MKAKTANHGCGKAVETTMWQSSPNPLPVLTPRERLHQNITRLQSLEEQLTADLQKQDELLTAIQLTGFKIRHLAQQIQETEQPVEAGRRCGNQPHSPACVC